MYRFILTVFGLAFALLARTQQITGIEYYVDQDPGVGQATFVSATSAADDVSMTVNADISVYGVGFHTLGFRPKDDLGKYGVTQSRKFYVISLSSVSQSPDLDGFEYYLNSDPGVGQGTFISKTNSSDLDETLSISLGDLSVGFHTLGLRSHSVSGGWGIAQTRKFYVVRVSSVFESPQLVGFEYFIDHDPGVGNGTFISKSASNDFDETLPISIGSLSAGFHTLSLRAKDASGNWGTAERRKFYMFPAADIVPSGNITTIEYFFDTDPGVGNGTLVTSSLDGGDITEDVMIDLTGKSIGEHTVYLRVIDANGKSSIAESATFEIRALGTDASLSDLTVDNTTITGFDAGTFTYDVTLPYGTTEISLGATPTDNNTVGVTGTGVISIEHQVSKTVDVEVTAEDGTTKQTYSVTFITEKNDDASLSDLTVDNTTITGFDAGTFTYDVTLPYGTSEINLAATATDDNVSGITGTGVISIEHQVSKTVDIEVTAEDGTTKQTYSVTFITEKNDDASLSDLTVDNTTITGFDAGTFTYDVSLPVGTTSIQLEAESNDPNASVSGNGTIDVSSGSASVGIMVTAEDQITSLTYTVNFTVQKITWNGNSWNNQIGPVESEDAVLAGNYVGSLTCKDLIVNSGVSVTITGTLDVHGDLENLGEITVESGSSLLTYSGKSINGEITIKRNTRYADGKYSFVGLPIQQKSDVSGSLLGPIVYQYNETTPFGNDGLSRWEDAAGIELMPGKGYAQANQQLIEFTGTPNSGTIVYSGTYTQDIDDSNEGWNMVANPYPAAIKTADFLTENVNNTTGSLYLWDDNGSDVGRGSNNDYITVNISGATDNNPANGNIESRYNQYIGSSQGFFVKLDESGNKQVVFNETMRDPGNNSDDHFFRRTEAVQRVRINLMNGDGLFKQTLIAWNNDVNDDQLNKLYDAQIFNQNADNAIYSFKNGVPLAIQTITENKLAVGLGYNVGYQGVYTIQADISEYDKELYLIDHMTNEVVDLTIQDYQFSASQGQIVDRFELTFEQKVILNSENFAGWNVFSNGNEIRFIPEKSAEGQTFRVFSLDGRLILEKYMDHSTRVILNVLKGIYLVSDGKDSNKIVIK